MPTGSHGGFRDHEPDHPRRHRQGRDRPRALHSSRGTQRRRSQGPALCHSCRPPSRRSPLATTCHQQAPPRPPPTTRTTPSTQPPAARRSALKRSLESRSRARGSGWSSPTPKCHTAGRQDGVLVVCPGAPAPLAAPGGRVRQGQRPLGRPPGQVAGRGQVTASEPKVLTVLGLENEPAVSVSGPGAPARRETGYLVRHEHGADEPAGRGRRRRHRRGRRQLRGAAHGLPRGAPGGRRAGAEQRDAGVGRCLGSG